MNTFEIISTDVMSTKNILYQNNLQMIFLIFLLHKSPHVSEAWIQSQFFFSFFFFFAFFIRKKMPPIKSLLPTWITWRLTFAQIFQFQRFIRRILPVEEKKRRKLYPNKIKQITLSRLYDTVRHAINTQDWLLNT